MILAIYHGRVYATGDDLNECVLLERDTDAEALRVPYDDPALLVDPTDAQVEAAEKGLPIPPETCAVCQANPRHEHEWQYRNRDGYGVCDDCGRETEQQAQHG